MSDIKKKIIKKFKPKFKTSIKASNELVVDSVNNELIVNEKQLNDKCIVFNDLYLNQMNDCFVFKTANGKQILLSNDKIAKVVNNLWPKQTPEDNEDNNCLNNCDNNEESDGLVPSLNSEDFESKKSSVDYLVNKSEDNSFMTKTENISRFGDNNKTSKLVDLKTNEKKRLVFEPFITGPDVKKSKF